MIITLFFTKNMNWRRFPQRCNLFQKWKPWKFSREWRKLNPAKNDRWGLSKNFSQFKIFLEISIDRVHQVTSGAYFQWESFFEKKTWFFKTQFVSKVQLNQKHKPKAQRKWRIFLVLELSKHENQFGWASIGRKLVKVYVGFAAKI